MGGNMSTGTNLGDNGAHAQEEDATNDRGASQGASCRQASAKRRPKYLSSATSWELNPNIAESCTAAVANRGELDTLSRDAGRTVTFQEDAS